MLCTKKRCLQRNGSFVDGHGRSIVVHAPAGASGRLACAPIQAGLGGVRVSESSDNIVLHAPTAGLEEGTVLSLRTCLVFIRILHIKQNG